MARFPTLSGRSSAPRGRACTAPAIDRQDRVNRVNFALIPGFVAALFATLIPAPAIARDSLGMFSTWGAFRDPAVPRCYAVAMAAVTLLCIPSVLVFLLLQRYFIQGISIGSIKG